jgi:hypothetical protein
MMQRQNVEVEMQQQRQSVINQNVSTTVGIVDSLNIITIFTLFLKDVFRKMLEETARFILFPMAAAFPIIQACLAWRQASIDRGKNGTLAKAVVETAAAIAITTAVIGALVTTTLFAFAAPMIFTATLAAKTLFHFGAACYYWGKSVATSDEAKKTAYRAAARGNMVGATALVLSTIAVAGVMLLAKPLMALIGITAGFIAISYSIYTWVKTPIPPKGYVALKDGQKQKQEHKVEDPKTDQSLTNSARLHRSVSNGLSKGTIAEKDKPSSIKPWSPNDRNYPKNPSKIKSLWQNTSHEEEFKGKLQPETITRERRHSI